MISISIGSLQLEISTHSLSHEKVNFLFCIIISHISSHMKINNTQIITPPIFYEIKNV